MKVGSGLDDGVTIGPLIDAKAVDSTDAMVADALDKGASLTTGGERIERPRLLLRADGAPRRAAGHPAARARRSSVRCSGSPPSRPTPRPWPLANDTEYGLVSYAYTRDLAARTG